MILGGGGIGGAFPLPDELALPTWFDAELPRLGRVPIRGSVLIREAKVFISSAVSTFKRALRHISAGFLFCSMLSISWV